MTPILATSPDAEPRIAPLPMPRVPRRGFTLLELMVVLSILGIVTALAAPSLLRTIDAWQRQSLVDALFDQLRALPGKARAHGMDIHIDAESLAGERPPVPVAPGWTLTPDAPWRVRANGLCEGGTLQLSDGSRSWTIAVSAPFCEPRLATAAP
jgi:general secretion pathway protein G